MCTTIACTSRPIIIVLIFIDGQATKQMLTGLLNRLTFCPKWLRLGTKSILIAIFNVFDFGSILPFPLRISNMLVLSSSQSRDFFYLRSIFLIPIWKSTTVYSSNLSRAAAFAILTIASCSSSDWTVANVIPNSEWHISKASFHVRKSPLMCYKE